MDGRIDNLVKQSLSLYDQGSLLDGINLKMKISNYDIHTSILYNSGLIHVANVEKKIHQVL